MSLSDFTLIMDSIYSIYQIFVIINLVSSVLGCFVIYST